MRSLGSLTKARSIPAAERKRKKKGEKIKREKKGKGKGKEIGGKGHRSNQTTGVEQVIDSHHKFLITLSASTLSNLHSYLVFHAVGFGAQRA